MIVSSSGSLSSTVTCTLKPDLKKRVFEYGREGYNTDTRSEDRREEWEWEWECLVGIGTKGRVVLREWDSMVGGGGGEIEKDVRGRGISWGGGGFGGELRREVEAAINFDGQILEVVARKAFGFDK